MTFARPSFQTGLSVPGSTRLVPDISMVGDPFTGAEIIETINGQLSVGVVGGTSLATPLFSGFMAIAAQKAGHGFGQAATLLYTLPAGAVTDVVAVSSPNDVTGVINGTPIPAAQLGAPLENTTSFFSAIYNSPFSTRWFVITFGTDSSLVTGPGWDNVTGVYAEWSRLRECRNAVEGDRQPRQLRLLEQDADQPEPGVLGGRYPVCAARPSTPYLLFERNFHVPFPTRCPSTRTSGMARTSFRQPYVLRQGT